jgi:HSP20 family protein
MELDTTIKQVERLYHSVTGQDMPPMDPNASAIPPERDPAKHVEDQLGRLEQALTELGSVQAQPTAPPWAPPLSVWETPEAIFVCVSLPGVQRTDLRLTYNQQGCVIEGTRNLPTPVAEASAQRTFGEDTWGPFRRIMPMPPQVRIEDIEAKLLDGLLTICMKKGVSPKEAQRTIPVN